MYYLKTNRRVIFCAVMISLVLAVAGSFLMEDVIPFRFAILQGLGVGVLMFIQTARSVSTAVMLEPAQAQMYMTKQYMFRMFIYLVAIFSAVKAENLNVLGTLLGLLSIKLAIILLAILDKYQRN